MVPALSLWLPVLLSAVFVFIASSVIHMVFKYHAGDFKPLPSEDEVMSDLGKYQIPPGEYYMPHISDWKDREKPEVKEKLEKGPVAFMTVTTADYAMGRALGAWFVYCALVGLLTAYVTGLALAPGADYMAVFRMASTVAFAGYFLALVQNSIWYKRAWSTTAKYLLDGLIYAALTAGTFAWLWPGG
ncbi:MAG: hypothetical protein KJN78_02860 [Gammaproteobacteria bacterium]|nr:hypothetical protein [Gammaproteobacteria bacterium]